MVKHWQSLIMGYCGSLVRNKLPITDPPLTKVDGLTSAFIHDNLAQPSGVISFLAES